MATIPLTDKKPLQTLPFLEIENKSSIIFEKCFLNSEIEYKNGVKLRIEFKIPIKNKDGSITYNTNSEYIDTTPTNKENNPVIIINKPIAIPFGCTILNIYGNNDLFTSFDFDLYYSLR